MPACPQSIIASDAFQHILRVLNTNVDGKQKIMYAVTAIKGISRRFSNLACKKGEVDMRKRWAAAARARACWGGGSLVDRCISRPRGRPVGAGPGLLADARVQRQAGAPQRAAGRRWSTSKPQDGCAGAAAGWSDRSAPGQPAASSGCGAWACSSSPEGHAQQLQILRQAALCLR
jgi:hypothetical protein